MLLTSPLQGLNWQGTGSGMNSTVITEIWKDLESNLNTGLRGGTTGKNGIVNELS